MLLVDILSEFQIRVGECDSLVASAHKTYPDGEKLFSESDKRYITVAAFLKLFIGWETFLEDSFSAFMIGETTICGRSPVRYVCPRTRQSAREILIGTMKFFDYSNHEFIIKISKLYFENGYPYEPIISSVASGLADMKKMRNASAHVSSTTQTALESLALRIFSSPRPGIDLYTLLTSIDPRSRGNVSVFETYKKKLQVTCELIANG